MGPQLITYITEVQKQVPVNMTSDFDTVSSFLRTAETSYVSRLIGPDQFNALVALYQGDVPLSAEVTEAVDLCQKVISNIGYYFAIPILSVKIGSSGIQIFSNQDTKNAFQWQVTDLKEALVKIGFNAIEELLTYLEENPATFTEYAGSTQLAVQKACLITSAVEFSSFYEINNSRLVYSTVTYIMKRVEQQNIVKLIGSDFLTSLKQTGLTTQQTTLIDTYLKPGIALLTIAKALTERVISLDNGRVVFNFRGRTANLEESIAATALQVENTVRQLEQDGAIFLQDGLQYITDNITDFPTFSPPAARRRFKVTNEHWHGLFSN